MEEKPSVTLPGKVEKIIESSHPKEPERRRKSRWKGPTLCIKKFALRIHSRTMRAMRLDLRKAPRLRSPLPPRTMQRRPRGIERDAESPRNTDDVYVGLKVST